MENLIEELTKVNPTNLSEEGLKLFNKINEIIDRNEELEKNNEKYKIQLTDEQYLKIIDSVETDVNKEWKSKIEDFLKRSKIVTNESKNKTYFLIDVTEIRQKLLQEGDK